MATLKEMSRRMKGLNLFKIYQEIIKEETETILNLNRDQLLKGKTSKGQKIKPKYKNKAYAKKKKGLNTKPGLGTPDLKLSGAFHASFTLKNKSGTFVYGAKAAHSKFLIPKYDDIFGLDPKNTKLFLDRDFIEAYNKAIREQLQI
jgi:hypothetical protein